MSFEILAPAVVASTKEARAHPSNDVHRQAAEQLQIAFFQDMLMHGGFAEAFSTGSNTLDSFTSMIVENVAKEIAAKDTSLADHFYRQLQGPSAADRA